MFYLRALVPFAGIYGKNTQIFIFTLYQINLNNGLYMLPVT